MSDETSVSISTNNYVEAAYSDFLNCEFRFPLLLIIYKRYKTVKFCYPFMKFYQNLSEELPSHKQYRMDAWRY